MPAHRPIDRRHFLGGAAIAAASAAVRARDPHNPAMPFPGMITRERDPLNLEFPFSALAEPITPTERFFIRNHFPVPALDPATWRLVVDGEVQRELRLSLDDLRKFPATTRTVTIECAGNGRAALVPKPRGLLWAQGAVGTAEWTGVPLAAVLEHAGVKDGAVEVILTGADKGEVNDDPKSPGVIPFERSLPLEKARRPEVLLAYQMNGRDLTPEHGFPLRAVVSGWYGMASVKWLTQLTVTATPFQGFWQTFDYSYFRREQGRPLLTPIQEIQVKASIARPTLREVVPAGTTYRVFGAAWAGESEVATVKVSTDGGQAWQPATLLGEAVPFSWRFWEYSWAVPTTAGRYAIAARATDRHGRTQPMTRDKDRRTYMINHVVPVEIDVR